MLENWNFCLDGRIRNGLSPRDLKLEDHHGGFHQFQSIKSPLLRRSIEHDVVDDLDISRTVKT